MPGGRARHPPARPERAAGPQPHRRPAPVLTGAAPGPQRMAGADRLGTYVCVSFGAPGLVTRGRRAWCGGSRGAMSVRTRPRLARRTASVLMAS
jgi:hypothetical protein